MNKGRMNLAEELGRIDARSNPNSNEWNSDYDIVRVGIYLQDTSKYSGGLQLRKGSHRSSNRWKGKIFTALAEQGDFLVWKLTTTHSGNTLIPRRPKNRELSA